MICSPKTSIQGHLRCKSAELSRWPSSLIGRRISYYATAKSHTGILSYPGS